MWESPIQMITDDIVKDITQKQDDCLVEYVHRVGFDVDKEELAKALAYDRDQYEKGFRDGREDRDDEIVRCKDCAKNSFTKCPMAIGWQSDYDYCSCGERKESE